MKRYQVIYIWQGERHVHSSQFTTLTRERGLALVSTMLADGWQCWLEEVIQ